MINYIQPLSGIWVFPPSRVLLQIISLILPFIFDIISVDLGCCCSLGQPHPSPNFRGWPTLFIIYSDMPSIYLATFVGILSPHRDLQRHDMVRFVLFRRFKGVILLFSSSKSVCKMDGRMKQRSDKKYGFGNIISFIHFRRYDNEQYHLLRQKR